MVHKRQRIPKGQSKMGNQEKPAQKKKNKTKAQHNMCCLGHHYTQADPNNVSKT